MILYQVCSNEGPRIQDGPAPGVLCSSHTATLKNIQNFLLQNHLALMLEMGYVALPSGPTPILFK